LFYLFFILLVSDRYYLDATNFGNLQDLQEEDFDPQLAGSQGKCSLTMFIIYSFYFYFRKLHAFKLNLVLVYPSLLFLVHLVMGCVSG
jgi:uncharacterized membrane protein SpoIIM required for sporulation